MTTVDHKKIGLLYLHTSLFFFIVGGLEAVFIRTQLMRPNMGFVSAETYNQLFTMHGTTMIFLAVMPLSSAFFNFIMPLQIGARDVAFPRLNAFSYWLVPPAGLLTGVVIAGMVKGAARERIEPMEVVERYTRSYFEDMDALGVQRPDISPRASAA